MQYFTQSIGVNEETLIPRIFKGIPDSEFDPAVVLTIKRSLIADSQALMVDDLPAEPVMPTMVSFLPLIL